MFRALLAVLLLPPSVLAQNAGQTSMEHDRAITISRAARTSTPIELDGRLTEAAWASAPVTD